MPEQTYFQVPEGQPVVANLGMGVDSSAIVTRWLLEPQSRGFDLDQLTILIASVGEEYQRTKDAMEQCLFPLIARHRVRTVQVARAGQSVKEGYVVLDDTRTPTRLVTEVPVTLGGRMLDVGTVPQVSSTLRACSDWIKHLPLDSWLADHVGHAPFVHCIGYSAEEVRRAQRDLDGNKGHRRPDFPSCDGTGTGGPLRTTCWPRTEESFPAPRAISAHFSIRSPVGRPSPPAGGRSRRRPCGPC